MNCRSAESLFSSYLEDEISQEERRNVESHLMGCRRCSLAMREVRATMSMLARIPEAEAGGVPWATVCPAAAAGGATAIAGARSGVRDALTRAGLGRSQACPTGETRKAATTAHAPAPAR